MSGNKSGKKSNISNNAILRLARQAGIQQLSSPVYGEIRPILAQHLKLIINNTLRHISERGVKTVKGSHVIDILESMGRPRSKDINYIIKTCRKTEQTGSGYEYQDYDSFYYTDENEDYTDENEDYMSGQGTDWIGGANGSQYKVCFRIPKLPFNRLVKEIAKNNKQRFSQNAMDLIQLDAENYLINLFENAHLQAIHANRIRVMLKDVLITLKMFEAC